MKDFNNERYIGDSSYQVSIEGTKKILEQMKFSVCKILNVEKKGTGFFCNIPLPEINL